MRSCGPLEECLIEWALFSVMLDAWGSICLMLPCLNSQFTLTLYIMPYTLGESHCACGHILTA